MPWPGNLERIREDVSPEVLGYAWFDRGSGEIVIPEDLDAGLLFHELSHAWLAGDRFVDRWVSEGLAEVVGSAWPRRPAARPRRSRPRARRRADALPLVAWADVDVHDGTDATEEYAYAAAWTAVSALVGGLDDEALGSLVAAAYAGRARTTPPASPGAPASPTVVALDLVEVRGEVPDAQAAYRAWVADAEETALLDARGPAREAYVALDAADGAWLPPAGLRTAMTDWAFADADAAREAIGPDAAATAGQVQQAAEDAGLPDPAAVRAQYEGARTAEEYAALATVLPRTVEVVGTVGDAVAASAGGGPFADLGRLLLDVDGSTADARAALDAGRLDDAAAAADDASSRAAVAPWVGIGAVLLVVAALAGAVVLVVRRRRAAAAQGVPVEESAADHDVRPAVADPAEGSTDDPADDPADEGKPVPAATP